MKRKVKVLITFIVLVILVILLYLVSDWFSLFTGYVIGGSQQQTIARCLEKQGAEYYFSATCVSCERQEKEFGRAIRSVTRIDCGEVGELCPNIRTTPAWYFPRSKEKVYYGFMSLEEINSRSGC
jgi:hypothetical protein